MNGSLSVEAKARALRSVFADGAVFVGLGVELVGDDVREVADPGYERQLLRVSDPITSGDLVATANAEEVAFEFAEDAESPVRYWFVVDGADEVLASGELDGDPVTPRAGWAMRFAPGKLVLGLGGEQ